MRRDPAAFLSLTEEKRPSKRDKPRSRRCVLAALDTVGLAFPVGDFTIEGGHVTIDGYGKSDEVLSVRHQLPGGGFVSVGRGKAWVEASAKRVDGSNVRALPVATALESMRAAVDEAWQFCSPRDGEIVPFERFEIVRLDPVRDFDGVAHVGELLDGLAAVPRDARHKVRRYSDAERNRAESVRVGPKAWASTLYDKFAETGGRCDPGRVRYEGRFHRAQLQSAWAESGGFAMTAVADLTSGGVSALTRESFGRVGFGREVMGRGSLASQVFGSGLHPKEALGLWAFLTAPGVAESMSKNARTKYRRFARDLGVTFVAGESAEVRPVRVSLDFDSGREVVRVA